ncbi:winged helix-turn-helix transcriptional regulator [Streptomyces lydicus]|uniref:winged helix-turn-helix transcriptional regulator n=1 Tax=Streptomyces lydicus TaxID=47763 RepID=UPI0033D74779
MDPAPARPCRGRAPPRPRRRTAHTWLAARRSGEVGEASVSEAIARRVALLKSKHPRVRGRGSPVPWHGNGTLGFRPLQQRCDGMSSSVLHQRLTELRESRLVERDAGDGYRLTPLGEGACEELRGLHHWAEGWAAELARVLPDRPAPAS